MEWTDIRDLPGSQSLVLNMPPIYIRSPVRAPWQDVVQLPNSTSNDPLFPDIRGPIDPSRPIP